jgi:hypothetical protein
MLFHVTWDFIDHSEAGQKRSLQLFSKWQPGPGQFQAFYGFADGGGGVALRSRPVAPLTWPRRSHRGHHS